MIALVWTGALIFLSSSVLRNSVALWCIEMQLLGCLKPGPRVTLEERFIHLLLLASFQLGVVHCLAQVGTCMT